MSAISIKVIFDLGMMCFVGFVPLLTSIDHSSKCRTQRAEVTNEGKMDLVEMDSPATKRSATPNYKWLNIYITHYRSYLF